MFFFFVIFDGGGRGSDGLKLGGSIKVCSMDGIDSSFEYLRRFGGLARYFECPIISSQFSVFGYILGSDGHSL